MVPEENVGWPNAALAGGPWDGATLAAFLHGNGENGPSQILIHELPLSTDLINPVITSVENHAFSHGMSQDGLDNAPTLHSSGSSDSLWLQSARSNLTVPLADQPLPCSSLPEGPSSVLEGLPSDFVSQSLPTPFLSADPSSVTDTPVDDGLAFSGPPMGYESILHVGPGAALDPLNGVQPCSTVDPRLTYSDANSIGNSRTARETQPNLLSESPSPIVTQNKPGEKNGVILEGVGINTKGLQPFPLKGPHGFHGLQNGKESVKESRKSVRRSAETVATTVGYDQNPSGSVLTPTDSNRETEFGERKKTSNTASTMPPPPPPPRRERIPALLSWPPAGNVQQSPMRHAHMQVPAISIHYTVVGGVKRKRYGDGEGMTYSGSRGEIPYLHNISREFSTESAEERERKRIKYETLQVPSSNKARQQAFSTSPVGSDGYVSSVFDSSVGHSRSPSASDTSSGLPPIATLSQENSSKQGSSGSSWSIEKGSYYVQGADVSSAGLTGNRMNSSSEESLDRSSSVSLGSESYYASNSGASSAKLVGNGMNSRSGERSYQSSPLSPDRGSYYAPNAGVSSVELAGYGMYSRSERSSGRSSALGIDRDSYYGSSAGVSSAGPTGNGVGGVEPARALTTVMQLNPGFFGGPGTNAAGGPRGGTTRNTFGPPQTLGYSKVSRGRKAPLSWNSDRRFVCQKPGCSRAFARNDGLTRHMRTVHTVGNST